MYRNTSDSDHHYELLKSYFHNDALRRKGFYKPKGNKDVLPQIRKRAMWDIYRSCLDDILINNTDIDDVVDLGCGMGHFVLELDQRRSFQRIVGLDFLRDTFQVALENSRLFAGVSFVEGDLVQMPFRKRSFDVSFCLNVMHHIHGEDVEQVINEIKRITKKFIVIEIRNNAYLFNFWYKHIVHRHYKQLPMSTLSIGDMAKFMNTFTCIHIVGKRRFRRLCRRLVLIYQRNDGEEL